MPISIRPMTKDAVMARRRALWGDSACNFV
jgi:hypothetical protein